MKSNQTIRDKGKHMKYVFSLGIFSLLLLVGAFGSHYSDVHEVFAATAVATSQSSVFIPGSGTATTTSTPTATPTIDTSLTYTPTSISQRTVIATATASVFIPSSTPSRSLTYTPTPDETEIEKNKRVRNRTDSGATTKSDPAEPDDELEYYLEVENLSDNWIYDYVIEDDIEDILDYARVIDLDDDADIDDDIISWDPVDIPPNDSVEVSFRVRVRDPLPRSGDRIMINTFGDRIKVYVDDDETPTRTYTPTKTYTRTRTPTRTYTPTKTPVNRLVDPSGMDGTTLRNILGISIVFWIVISGIYVYLKKKRIV